MRNTTTANIGAGHKVARSLPFLPSANATAILRRFPFTAIDTQAPPRAQSALFGQKSRTRNSTVFQSGGDTTWHTAAARRCTHLTPLLVSPVWQKCILSSRRCLGSADLRLAILNEVRLLSPALAYSPSLPQQLPSRPNAPVANECMPLEKEGTTRYREGGFASLVFPRLLGHTLPSPLARKKGKKTDKPGEISRECDGVRSVIGV